MSRTRSPQWATGSTRQILKYFRSNKKRPGLLARTTTIMRLTGGRYVSLCVVNCVETIDRKAYRYICTHFSWKRVIVTQDEGVETEIYRPLAGNEKKMDRMNSPA
jgi:hypothetical protein